jgi:hypothetical protein
MESLGYALLVIGGLGLYAGWFWSLRLAFREGVGYGIVCLFVPILLFFFLTMNVNRTWKPLLLLTCSIAAFGYGFVLIK